MFGSHHIAELFIVDKEFKPRRILTLTDILNYISNIDLVRAWKLKRQKEKQTSARYKAIINRSEAKQLDHMFVEGVTLPYPIGSKMIWKTGNAFFRVGAASMQGWRATMEDAHVIMLDVPNKPNHAIFGVFDGHGGSYVANLVAQELPQALCQLPDIFDEEAIKDVCIKVDEKCLEYFQKFTPDELLDVNEGTTAAVTIIKRDDTGTYKIMNINIGDSRIVLAKRDPKKTKLYTAIPCTTDQNPYSKTERKRVRACGGFISEDKRVDGMLSVTRAFGDAYFKYPFDDPPEKHKVIAIPVITTFEGLQPQDFIFISCDGIYEANQPDKQFDRQGVIDWLSKKMHSSSQKQQNLGTLAAMLLNKCLSKESTDNMSAIIIQFSDGRDHVGPPTFLPGPSKIPKKFHPHEQSEALFNLAYTENAKAAGYTLEEVEELRKKMGIKSMM
eukprot:TRINITY_DN4460_c1_g1_i2.p1 TRINITY_DN4460_c1_g1~~TRINITY_DN4460_c1_g1_i2.p1  ORF type:complete len:443 (-),score=55.07 TRINITY_DN4460_c1_g1_i2:13-1341(-)